MMSDMFVYSYIFWFAGAETDHDVSPERKKKQLLGLITKLRFFHIQRFIGYLYPTEYTIQFFIVKYCFILPLLTILE